ncbi:MAG: hypothetical protein R3B54_16715 [Bdellovibrionota bacterium]
MGGLVHRVDKTGGRIIGVVLAVGFVIVAASGLSAIWLAGLAAGSWSSLHSVLCGIQIGCACPERGGCACLRESQSF